MALLNDVEYVKNDKCEQVQRVALDMLSVVVDICKKHGIRYIMFYGSLLGAVRHGGFIPWDDDLDIAMPREDYERFKALCLQELPEYYFFQDYTTDPEYPALAAKVRDSRTTMIENGYKNLKKMNHGVFLDVFVADGYSEKKMNKLRLLLVRLYKGMMLRRACGNGNPLLRLAAGMLNRKRTFCRIEHHLRSLGEWEDKCIIDGKVYSTDIFDDCQNTDFSGVMVRIPRDADGLLRAEYGDYMSLPPYEKRVPVHMTELVDVNVPFSEFISKNIF